MPNLKKPVGFKNLSNANSKIPSNFELLQKIGRRLKLIREVKGISLSRLSDLSKIDEIKLKRYEAGIDKNFAIDELIVICDILETPSYGFFM